MNDAPEFQPYGLPHLTVIFITIVLPFALAALVRRTKSQRIERIIVVALSAVLILNYLAYLVFIRSRGVVDWRQMLPMQMCDWGMVVVMVAMWTGSQRWFEVGYFWGIGGTLQAVLTPNLPYGFPDWRFISFFTSHCGIIVCTRDDDSVALAGRIHQALATLASLDGQLVRVIRPPPRSLP